MMSLKLSKLSPKLGLGVGLSATADRFLCMGMGTGTVATVARLSARVR